MIKSASDSNNVYIDRLQAQLTNVDASIDYLVIAHPDQAMLRALQGAFSDSTMAVVTLPQDSWAMDDKTQQEIVQWAVNELNVRGVLLVGHSQGGTPNDLVCLMNAGQPSQPVEPVNRVASLFERARQSHARVAQCESHFASQLEKLRNQPAIVARGLRDSALIQGLFYRVEGGLFCAFNPETQSFAGLIEPVTVGQAN